MRGEHFDTILLDELGFCNEYTVMVLAVVMLANRGCFWASASSPSSRLSRWLNKKYESTGQTVFQIIRATPMCQLCLDNHADECPHMPSGNPPWKKRDRKTKEMQVSLFGKENAALMRQELHGALEDDVGSDKNVFPEAIVEKFFSTRVYELGHLPDGSIGTSRCWVLAVDPSGGGKGSDVAVTAFARNEATGQILVRPPVPSPPPVPRPQDT